MPLYKVDVLLQGLKFFFLLQFVVVFELFDRFLKYFGMLLYVFRELFAHLEIDLSGLVFGNVRHHILTLILQIGKHVGFIIEFHSKVAVLQSVTKAVFFNQDPLRNEGQFQQDVTLIDFINFNLLNVLFLLVELVHVQLKFLRRWSLTLILITFNEFFIDLYKFCVVEGPVINGDGKSLRNNIFGGKERMFLDL